MSIDSHNHAAQDGSIRQVMGRVEEAVYALDTNWDFSYLNDCAAELLDADPETLLGESIWEVLPGATETDAFEAFHEAMETGEPTRIDMYYETTDRWFTVRAHPGPDGLTVCFEDVTGEQRQALEVQRKQRLFEAVFEDTRDALVVADTDRQVTEFNPAAEQLFGYDAEAMIGRSTAVLYADAEESDTQGEQRFNERTEERHEQYVVEYERADGTTFEGETVGTSLEGPDGETLAFLGAIRDVSPMVEYERQMEARNDALRAFHDITTDDDSSFAEQLRAVLDLGRDHLDLGAGILSDIDGTEYTVEHVVSADDTLEPGSTFELGETFCDLVVERDEVVSFRSATAGDVGEHPAYRKQDIESYLGAPVVVDGEPYGTLNFSSVAQRRETFTESEEAFVRVLAQWVGKELDRQRTSKQVRAERERLRQIIDAIPQQVFVKDRAGTYVLANEAAAAVHGLSVEQLEGASDEQFGFESDQRDFESDDMHVIDSGEPVHVAGDRFVDADGAEHVVETEILPLETEIDDRRALVVTTDITEQKALEADLKASQNRLRQVIDMLPQLVFAKDETGEFLLANEAVADAYGTTVDELEGATDADFAESPAEAEQFRADDRAVIASGEPQHIPEESMTTADGRRRTFETTKIPYDPVDAAGDAVLGVATDITERKQQEAELEVQVAAMETSMDGISILNAEDEYIYMNQAHADVFDYEPGDLLGGSWRQVYDDDELERLEQDVFPRLDRDGEWRGETVGVRRDGSPVHLEITLSVLDDGKLICTNRDISERKQRERELERYEALVESMEEAAFVVDSAGQLEYANEASLSHAATTFDEIDSKSVVALARELAADDAEIGPFERGLEAALRGESVPERYELRTDSPDDAQVMEYTFSPFSSAGDPKVAVVARDVTERRVRERELERQRSRLRALFDDSPDSIIVHDADGRVLDANETQVELLGYDRERLLSMNVAAFEVGHSRSELQAVWDDMAVGDTLKIEGNHRRSNGSIYPVEMWVARTEVAHEQRFVAVSRDISERKDRESELERNREFLERAQESASVGGWEIDFAADDLRWSDEVYRIHDLPLDADVSVADGLDYYHPDDRQTITDAFERLRTDGESYDLELRIVTADDTLRWVRTIADPRFDENGETIGAIGVFQDITERKERERDLQELTERLDLAVKGAGLAVWDWDMRTDDVTFNDQWASMLGLSPGDVEPTLESWEERVHPDDMDRVESALEAHMSGEAPLYDCEHRMLTASGDWKWIRDVGEVVERDASGEPARAVGIHIDISEQKATEQSLGAERDMFAQGPAVVFNWRNDDGWPVEYVSDNVSETFGYTPEELESGTVPYETLIHEDDAERVTAEVAAHSDETTERFSHDPYRMVTASGEVKWVKDNTKIIRKDGEITHYLGYLIDITDRKQLEESLRQSEQSIREITEIASDTERDFQEKLEAVLELGCERLGLPFGFLTRITGETQHITEAIGTHPLIQPGESAPLSKAYCRQTIEQDEILDVADALDEGWGDDPAYETFGLGCYIGGKVLVDGDLYGTLCFADRTSRPHEFDETQRAFVELLVQWISYELASDAVESKLRQLNETARELIATGDRDEIATIATQRPKSVLDLPVTGIWWYDESADALVPAGMTDEAASVIGEQPTFDGGNSLTWQAFEGREILVYDDLETAEGRHNEQTSLRSEVIVPLGEHGVLVSGSTQPRAFSETDRRLFEVLSATVEDALYRAEREEVLRETRERLEQSNEELEQFAYAASHDLQEPLRTISSYLTLLERRYRADLSDDAIEFVDLAVDGADRMRDMIQALLEYSRVDTRGGGFEPTEMSSVFDQIQRNLTVTIDETSATVDVPADPGTVMGDENQLVQLFQNLVENGIKYSEDDRRVDVSAERRDGVLEYAVADNGIGMELDQRDGIFEVFQRLHTREEFEGTGIGLSICRKIVDRHDGDIRVESTPGTGSTFYVTLPTETDHGD